MNKVYNNDLVYAYRVHYHDYWELEKFMKLFDLDIEDTGQKTLSKKIIDNIGDNLPIFRIGCEETYYEEFKELIESEFEFINCLFKWVHNHFPIHKQRAIKQLENINEIFLYNEINESTKALELLKNFNLNQKQKAKVFLLEKLLLPYTLDTTTKQNFIQLFKLK